jgi:hypothetical protein
VDGLYCERDLQHHREARQVVNHGLSVGTPVAQGLPADLPPTGELEACPGVMAGNVTQRPFAEVWRGPKFRDLRRRLARDVAFPICARCCVFCRTE